MTEIVADWKAKTDAAASIRRALDAALRGSEPDERGGK